MGTNLTYAGVTMTNVQTLEFRDKEPVRDPSDTDKWADETTIRVRTFLSTNTIGGYVPGGGGGAGIGSIGITSVPGVLPGQSPQSVENIVAGLLNQDRQSLTFTMAGVVMVQSDATTDVANGPKVTDLKITGFAAATLIVEFEVKTWQVQCPQFVPTPNMPTPGNKVLLNRWSCIDDMDERFCTTRVWQGILRVAGANFHPNDFRDMAVPPLFPGWKRKHLHFHSDPGGLVLAYSVVDQEMVGPAPPWPAAKMQFTHVETCGEGVIDESKGAGPVTGVGHCHVVMEGGRGADKRMMICRAANIIEQKLQLGASQQTFRILEVTVADYQSADTNRIEMQAKVQHCPTNNQTLQAFIANTVLGQMGLPLSLPQSDPGTGMTDPSNQGSQGSSNTNTTPQVNANSQAIAGYNPDICWALGSYGSATLTTAFAAFLQTPCGADGTHTVTGGYSNPASPSLSQPSYSQATNETPAVTYSTGAVSTTAALSTPPTYAGSGTQSIFQFYVVDSQLVKKFSRVQLPIAGLVPAGQPTTTTFTLGGAAAKRIVRITGECKNDWPRMPRDVDFTDHNGIQHSILKSKILSKARTPCPDGNSFDHSLAIEYTYALSRPPQSSESLPVGVLQWDGASNPSSNAVPSTAFIAPDDENYGIA